MSDEEIDKMATEFFVSNQPIGLRDLRRLIAMAAAAEREACAKVADPRGGEHDGPAAMMISKSGGAYMMYAKDVDEIKRPGFWEGVESIVANDAGQGKRGEE